MRAGRAGLEGLWAGKAERAGQEGKARRARQGGQGRVLELEGFRVGKVWRAEGQRATALIYRVDTVANNKASTHAQYNRGCTQTSSTIASYRRLHCRIRSQSK